MENKINDLLKQWIIFRDEELATLTKEDRKHPLRFEDFEGKLLKNLPSEYRKNAEILLEKMYDDFLDFSNYYNEKYYRAGFGDCLNLVIASLGGSLK